MQVLGKEIPCGCDQRKEIMFTQGGLSPQAVMPLVVVGLLAFGAWRLSKHA